jgi:hypothetical protein
MTILLTPMRPDRFPRHLQPPAEIPGITADRVIPRHADSPQEPEPAQQIHAIRTDRQLRPPGRLQMAEISSGRPDARAARVKQPVRLPPIPRGDQPARQRHHQPSQIPARFLLLDHDRRL